MTGGRLLAPSLMFRSAPAAGRHRDLGGFLHPGTQSMQYQRFNFLFVALALVGLVSTAARAQSQLDGSWTRNRQQSDNVNAAIDAAIRPMNFLVRAVARGRLRTANVAYERLVIASTADTVNVTYHERAPVITPANGAVVKWWREDGQDFDVSTEWENGRLIQTFRAPDGRRVNVYSVSADGRTLTMDVTLTTPRLAAPLRYKLVFDRAR